MKDDKLEQEFNRYFEGAEIPENVTADAKKYVTPKRRSVMPKLVKFASIAASLVLAAGVCVWAAVRFGSLGMTSDSAPDFAAEAPSAPSYGDADDSEAPLDEYYYDDSSLIYENVVYPFVQEDMTEDTESVLKLYDALALSEGAELEGCALGYLGGELALIKGEISLAYERATVYTELTDKIYEPLNGYAEGEKHEYNGYAYYLSEDSADGETSYKLLTEYRGVKYYVLIQSQDKDCYLKYLQAIFNL